MQNLRVAVVASHPVQYYAPWFRFLAATSGLDLRVFYLWDAGARERLDPGFGQTLRWDVPLLDGYAHEFVPNTSRQPGTERFFGLRNPMLPSRLAEFDPQATLVMGYNYWSLLRLIFGFRPCPLIFRGDSHRLAPRPPGWREFLRRRLIAAVYRRFAATLYVGRANREYFRWHGVPEGRLFFSPHAVDNSRFQAHAEATSRHAAAWRTELGVPADHALVTFAGKFEDKKRPLDLLEAFARAAVPRTSLLFVGGGHLEAVLRARAASIASVYFAPFQNQSLMPRTYAAADLFVLPSYGQGETWGLAVNEALCLARPVIVSDHVGCASDLVEPWRSGLVFPAGDVAALAAALREALSDRARLVRWGEQGRQIVNRYNYAGAAEGLLQAVAAVVQDR